MEALPGEANTSRRNVLRMLVGVPIGLAAGEILSDTSGIVQDEAHRLTGLEVGNAGIQDELRADCGTRPSDQCVDGHMEALGAQIKTAVITPIYEEIDFRVIPSVVRDVITDPDTDLMDATRNALVGRSRVPLTRGEFLTGAITSIIFGYTHDITYHGVDIRVLPVEQTIGGGVLWALQRKFGYFSNVTAHGLFNFRWLRNPR